MNHEDTSALGKKYYIFKIRYHLPNNLFLYPDSFSLQKCALPEPSRFPMFMMGKDIML